MIRPVALPPSFLKTIKTLIALCSTPFFIPEEWSKSERYKRLLVRQSELFGTIWFEPNYLGGFLELKWDLKMSCYIYAEGDVTPLIDAVHLAVDAGGRVVVGVWCSICLPWVCLGLWHSWLKKLH